MKKKSSYQWKKHCRWAPLLLIGGVLSACQVDFSVEGDGTVTIDDSVDNISPVATADTATINEDTLLTSFDVLANDLDVNGDPLTITSASSANGQVTVNTDNTLTFTPDANFFGTAVIDYTVSDGSASSSNTLTVTVQPINDAPIAVDDAATVDENSTDNIISILANDSDVEDASLTIDSASASFGNVSISGGSLLYSPQSDYVGIDTISYQVSDSGGAFDTAVVTVDVNQTSIPPVSQNNLIPGRPVVVAFQPRSPSPAGEPTDFNDWVRFDSPTNVNAPVISSDGSSITFSRTTVDDGLAARDYVEFEFGQRFAGTHISISMDVIAHSEGTTGVDGGSLHVPGTGLTGETIRYISESGTWATVLEVGQYASDTAVRIGLGVAEDDTQTNSITISNVQVSYLTQGDTEPNEYVTPNGWTSLTGTNGASLPYAKDADYNEQTGLVSFNSPTNPADDPAASHVMLMTDSFGNFFSAYTRELVFGGVNDLAPQYTMTVNTRAGRQLEDESDGVLLEEMYDLRSHPNAAAPGILAVHLGVNTFMLDQGTTADLAQAALQSYIDFAHARNMVAVITTATPFRNSTLWTQQKQDEMDLYNAAVRQMENGSDIRVIDLNALLDTDGDEILDAEFLTGNPDFIHAVGPAIAIMYNAYDQLINEIIAGTQQPSSSTVQASLVPSRTTCVSPCTVVFSAIDSQAEGLNEHEIWYALNYRFDFYDMPQGNFALTNKPQHFEIGGPMATRTLMCETGTCLHRVGLRVQNQHGEFSDAYTTITVNSESAQFTPAQTICVSNTLDTTVPWDGFDKNCPAGATQQSDFPLPDDYANTLILARKGDVFDRNVYTRMGQSNFKIGYFGNDVDPRPEITDELGIGPAGIGSPLDNPPFVSTGISDAQIAQFGWTSNVVVEGFRVGRVNYPMSYEHIGIHDMDLDQEFSPDRKGSIGLVNNAVLCHRNDNLSCSNVPFPIGSYVSDTTVIGSEARALTNELPLNLADVPCGMAVYTGLVGVTLGNTGEHNYRDMGWWKTNISHSHIAGHHKITGRTGITTRSCGDAFALEDFTGKFVQDPEGRTREDADTGLPRGDGNEEYSHLSRYYLVQNNVFGGNEVKPNDAIETHGMSFSTIPNRDHYMQDVMSTRNIFLDNGAGGNVGLTHGLYMTCTGNTYAPGNPGCAAPEGEAETRNLIMEGSLRENQPDFLPLADPLPAPAP